MLHGVADAAAGVRMDYLGEMRRRRGVAVRAGPELIRFLRETLADRLRCAARALSDGESQSILAHAVFGNVVEDGQGCVGVEGDGQAR